MPRNNGAKRVGLIEVLAIKDEVISDLGRGFPLTEIYRRLSGEGKLSVSYQSFRSNFKKICGSYLSYTPQLPPLPGGMEDKLDAILDLLRQGQAAKE